MGPCRPCGKCGIGRLPPKRPRLREVVRDADHVAPRPIRGGDNPLRVPLLCCLPAPSGSHLCLELTLRAEDVRTPSVLHVHRSFCIASHGPLREADVWLAREMRRPCNFVPTVCALRPRVCAVRANYPQGWCPTKGMPLGMRACAAVAPAEETKMISNTKRLLPPLLTALLGMTLLPSAAHSGTMELGYKLGISAKEIRLRFPDSQAAKTIASWDNSFHRIAARNAPWIEITNDPESDEDITRFTMTLRDDDAHFSDERFDFILPSETNPFDVELKGSVADDAQTLIVEITGLGPGKIARFAVNLDPNDPDDFRYPDFRLNMFHMNENDLSDNAVYTVEYEGGTVIEKVLPDYPVPPPIYAESNIRPHSVMEPVLLFEDSGGFVVPEPGGATLLGLCCLGLAGVVASHGRRRTG